MRLDKYSNPIFTEQELFDALYTGHQFTVDDTTIVDDHTPGVNELENQLGFKFLEPYHTDFETTEYDQACQQLWNMPDAYKTLNIEKWVFDQSPLEHQSRVLEELIEFKERNMLDLLKWLKYFVDNCDTNNILWGVGRGSSVASYVLFLIGVHSIDSVKYNLDWREFLR